MTAYLKALVGAATAALTAIGTGLGDGGLSAQECISAAVAALVAFSAIWAVPNKTA